MVFYRQIGSEGDEVRTVTATGGSVVMVVKPYEYIAPLSSAPGLEAMIKLGSRRWSMR